jgi:carbon monoxide dehydrogenase subunit G
MGLRPDPEVGYRRPGDHRRAEGLIERRVFIQAPPRVVWATLHDPVASAAIHPEIRLGPAAPSWPAAATTRPARTRLGLLRETARVESLEARPESRFRLKITGSGFDSEWSWQLESVAGGTRVIHAATFEPYDRWTTILVRFSRATPASRVETHLRVLKERSEAALRAAGSRT